MEYTLQAGPPGRVRIAREASELVGVTLRARQRWEAEQNPMPVAAWMLFQIRIEGARCMEPYTSERSAQGRVFRIEPTASGGLRLRLLEEQGGGAFLADAFDEALEEGEAWLRTESSDPAPAAIPPRRLRDVLTLNLEQSKHAAQTIRIVALAFVGFMGNNLYRIANTHNVGLWLVWTGVLFLWMEAAALYLLRGKEGGRNER